MRDRELIEQFGVPEIFVDGFTQHTSRDGVMCCVGYRKLKDGPTVVVRLIWPAANTNAAIDDALHAMTHPEQSEEPVGASREVH